MHRAVLHRILELASEDHIPYVPKLPKLLKPNNARRDVFTVGSQSDYLVERLVAATAPSPRTTSASEEGSGMPGALEGAGCSSVR